MKLINHTLLFLSAILLATLCLWGVLFYYQWLDQVKRTIDNGLANYKIALIDNLEGDSLITEKREFAENNFIIRHISEERALKIRDTYKDTLIFSSLRDDHYQARLLTSAFLAKGNRYYELRIISNELNKGILIREIAASLAWLFLFLFISTLIINNFVLKKTWKPFYRLLQYLDRFQPDKEPVFNPGKTRIKEFVLLNESFSNLVKKNIEIYRSQKQFIENASHELQTPLAISINKLELLAGEKDQSPEQILKIGNIIDILQRLTSLNKSLLLLSKIENRQYLSAEPVNIDELISKITDDLSEYTDFKGIKVKYHRNALWHPEMNPDLARIMILNLINNALYHNREGGEIIIKISPAALEIANTSNEPEIKTDRLFTRFARSKEDVRSTGLGLAIVKAIADVSGLTVTYSYSGMHLFKISQQ